MLVCSVVGSGQGCPLKSASFGFPRMIRVSPDVYRGRTFKSKGFRFPGPWATPGVGAGDAAPRGAAAETRERLPGDLGSGLRSERAERFRKEERCWRQRRNDMALEAVPIVGSEGTHFHPHLTFGIGHPSMYLDHPLPGFTWRFMYRAEVKLRT